MKAQAGQKLKLKIDHDSDLKINPSGKGGNTTVTIIYDGQRNKGQRGIIGTCSHKADQTVKQWHSPTLASGYVSQESGVNLVHNN